MLQLVFENFCRAGNISDACRRCFEDDTHWFPVKGSFSKRCVATQCISIRGGKAAVKIQDMFTSSNSSSSSSSSSKGENRLNWLRPSTASTKSDKYRQPSDKAGSSYCRTMDILFLVSLVVLSIFIRNLDNGKNYEKMLKSHWSERELRLFGRQPEFRVVPCKSP